MLCASASRATTVAAPVDDDVSAPTPSESRTESPSDEPGEASALTPCRAAELDSDLWLDKTNVRLYRMLCGTARWFDSFFGDSTRYDTTVDQTWGRLGAGAYYDERDEWDLDFRLRAQAELPAAKRRTRLLLGRGDEKELIEDRGTSPRDSLPSRFNEVEDNAWLLGLGFARKEGLKRGIDFGVGVRLGLPLEPYVKARFFRNWSVTEKTLLRFRQTGFWRDGRGLGTTSQFDIDHLIANNFLFRWHNWGTVAEDVDGLDWGSSTTLFQSLSDRRALAYRLFVRGETDAEERLKDYGLELRYRRRILRDWLFIEFVTGLSWPKETMLEKRELTLGAGVGLQLYFGPVPDIQLH